MVSGLRVCVHARVLALVVLALSWLAHPPTRSNAVYQPYVCYAAQTRNSIFRQEESNVRLAPAPEDECLGDIKPPVRSNIRGNLHTDLLNVL